jgi:hypothetical protein
MTRQAGRRLPQLRLIAFLAGASFAACACGAPAQHPGQATARVHDIRTPAQHAIDLFEAAPPPLLPILTGGQTRRLPKLPFTYGPAYQHGRILGLVVSYPGCEEIEGVTVAETATAVRVTVRGTPQPLNCVGSLLISTAAVRLPEPLGRRTEIQG